MAYNANKTASVVFDDPSNLEKLLLLFFSSQNEWRIEPSGHNHL